VHTLPLRARAGKVISQNVPLLFRGPRGPASQRPFPGAKAKLASFCILGARPTPSGPRPTRPPWELGSFCTFTHQPSHAQHDDSLCLDAPGNPSLASFCTIPCVSRLRRGEIGFVSHVSHPSGATHTATTLPMYPSPQRQIGFVLRISPPVPTPGRVKLGSFCTFHVHAEHPTRQLLCPYTPVHLSLASFCISSSVCSDCARRFSPPLGVSGGPNWVRFTRMGV
jgi:hypothetical protein